MGNSDAGNDIPITKFVRAEPAMTSTAIMLLVQSAVMKAENFGIAVNVAVMDCNRQLRAFVQMAGAHAGAADLAIDKAWTSAGFGGFSTQSVDEIMEDYPEIARSAILRLPRYTPLAGGVPIRVNNHLLGAIGVTGGTPDQDVACALAGFVAIGADALS